MEYISEKKLEELKDELKYLKNTRRSEIANDLETARAMGDLSENAEYSQARDNQAKLEARISQIEYILKNYKLAEPTNGQKVGIGSKVVVVKKDDKQKKEFELVGPEEVDMANGKISHKSPMGEAIMGKMPEEEFSFSTPKGEMIYKIKDIK